MNTNCKAGNNTTENSINIHKRASVPPYVWPLGVVKLDYGDWNSISFTRVDVLVTKIMVRNVASFLHHWFQYYKTTIRVWGLGFGVAHAFVFTCVYMCVCITDHSCHIWNRTNGWSNIRWMNCVMWCIIVSEEVSYSYTALLSYTCYFSSTACFIVEMVQNSQ